MNKESRLLKDEEILYITRKRFVEENLSEAHLLNQAQDTKSVKAITEKMKRTIIGEERGVKNETKIWFLFEDEYEALKRGIDEQ